MLDKTFKFVYISYKEGLGKPNDKFTLVTNVQYYGNYMVIEYYNRPDSISSAIIMTDKIEGMIVEELNELDSKREWVKMNNAVCGHDFTRIKFWPFEGKKSEIEIYPLYAYGEVEGTHLLYTNVVGIERKWNHDIRGNELYIRTIDFGKYAGFHDIEKIIVMPEEDIKKFIIKRSDHEDLEIKVNGGTYRDE